MWRIERIREKETNYEESITNWNVYFYGSEPEREWERAIAIIYGSYGRAEI